MASQAALSDKNMGGNKVTNLKQPTNANDAARKQEVDDAIAFARSRTNHQGSQTASTISDFDSQVRTSRLDQMAAPTAPVSMNGQKISNQADPTAAQDSATKNYVDTALAGLATGQTMKGAVRAYVSTNVTISSPGATLDGVAAAAGDIFILAGQTVGTENGPYTYNGATSAMTRALNWDTNAEAVLGSYWVVREGTRADSFALLTNDVAVNLGVTIPAFTVISVAGAAIGRYAENCPAVAAGATWEVNHPLNSSDVMWMVKRVASPYDQVDVYGETTSASKISIKPDVALASGEYRIVVKY